MEVVRPDAVEAPSALRLGTEHAGQVAVVLGDQVDGAVRGLLANPAAESSARKCRGPSSTIEWVASRRRPSMWYSWIQCRAFSMKNSADHLAAGTIEIDRGTPGRPVPVGEIGGAEASQITPIGAEVVVDDVEQHRHAQGMGRVHQSTEVVGRAVTTGRGEEVDAVVSPVATAGEVGDRHQLDRGDPQAGPDRAAGRRRRRTSPRA